MVRWAAVLMMALSSLAGWTESNTQPRFAISAHQVALALTDKGIPVNEAQVVLAADIVAEEREPVLDILSIEAGIGSYRDGGSAGSGSWVKLACHRKGICLPFYITIYAPVYATTKTPEKTGSGNKAETRGESLPKNGIQSDVPILMRAGTHAMLVMDDDRAHIQLAVVSLENGAAGRRIRVASTDRKHVYFGEVVSASVLRGSF